MQTREYEAEIGKALTMKQIRSFVLELEWIAFAKSGSETLALSNQKQHTLTIAAAEKESSFTQ